MEKETKKGFFNNPLTQTKIKSANVKLKEMLFGYFLGPFGALLSSGIFGAILSKYWTDVLFTGEASAAVDTFLTLLPLISIVFVVVGNLAMGQLLERTKTMAGKARPWLLLSAFTISVSSVLMFIVPFQNSVAKMIWVAIGYNLFYAVAYPIYNTANSTMIPVSTRNGKQRGLLASASNIAGLAVMGAGSMVFPILASNLLGNNKTLWFIAMLAIAIFAALSCLLQFFFTRERVTEEEIQSIVVKEKIPVKKQLKAVATDRTWWIIIIFWFLFQVGGALQNTAMPYFSQWVVSSIGGDWGVTMTVLGIVGAVPMAIAVALVWPLSNKFGKKNLTVVGLCIGVVGGVIAGLFPSNMITVAIGIALQCLGAAPACYMILAMIADELDHLEAKNGFRCDGLTMSLYSLIAAVMTGIAMGVVIGMIQGNGYIAPPEDAQLAAQIVQNDAVKGAITFNYIWARTIAFGIGIVLMLFFGVEKHIKKEQEQIVEAQKAAVLAAGGEWIEPAKRLRLEQEEYDRIADEARKEELRAHCKKKGLSFEQEEAQYQRKLLLKQEKRQKKRQAEKQSKE